MLQFTRNPEEGRCAFADRYQFRFELNWLRVDMPPDLQRMAEDYIAKLTDNGLKDVKRTAHSPWLGATGLEKGQPISRYAAFFAARSMLLEVVFIWPTGVKASPAFEGRTLDAVTVKPDALDGAQVWDAFGMRWKNGPDLYFEKCTAAPGMAEAVFTNEKRHIRQSFSRRGLLKEWFSGSVEQWLEEQVPREYTISERKHSSRDGHDFWSIEARRSRPVLADWVHGHRLYKSAAWLCHRDDRLYCVSFVSHPDYATGCGVPALSCCPALEVTP